MGHTCSSPNEILSEEKEIAEEPLLENNENRNNPYFEMSKLNLCVLDHPRIHFSGKFRANPATINNQLISFRKASTLSFPEFKKECEGISTWEWNPYGDNTWSFNDCLITNGYKFDGGVDDDLMKLELALNPSCRKISGRMVDIDPEAQMMPQLFGFSLHVGDRNNSNQFYLKGDFDPYGYQDLWLRRVNEKNKNMGDSTDCSATYISVLKNCEFFSDTEKNVPEIFKQLRYYSENNDYKLQVKFVVDCFHKDSTLNSFTYGRVVGIIGPWTINNPKTSIIGRHLTLFNLLPFPTFGPNIMIKFTKIHNNKNIKNYLYIDFMNGIPTCGDGELRDCGDIVLLYHKDDNWHEVGKLSPQEYLNPDFYLKNSGIKTYMNVNEEIFEGDHRLKVTYKVKADLWNHKNLEFLICQEEEHGFYVKCETEAVRLGTKKNTKATLTLYTTQYGKLITTKDKFPMVKLDYTNIATGSCDEKNPDGESPYLNWEKKIHFPNVNNEYKIIDGITEIIVKAPDTLYGIPKHLSDVFAVLPRGYYYMDSLVYQVKYKILKFIHPHDKDDEKNPSILATQALPSTTIHVLVSDESNETLRLSSDKEPPTWIKHIEPILKQYASLFPVMRPIILLDDFGDVTSKLSSLRRAFNAPFETSYYMPVTRDLSQRKLDMINTWLENPVFDFEFTTIPEDTIKTIPDLKLRLQQAIELEFATIPLYLSSLYSIKNDSTKNNEVRKIIAGIVHQEMLHMGLACNLLISVGGTPKIAFQECIPHFPSTGLPGNIMPTLKLQLKPCTRDDIHETFMKIESPAETIPWDHKNITSFYKPKLEMFELLFKEHKELRDKYKAESNLDNNGGDIEYITKMNNLIQMIESETIDPPKILANPKTNNLLYVAPVSIFNTLRSENIEKKIAHVKFKHNTNTIGDFYNTIREGFKHLVDLHPKDLFKVTQGNAYTKEAGPEVMIGLNYVYNYETALDAINTIVTQGEGTSMTDIWDANSQLSHYHRFMEIVVGKRLILVRKVSNQNSLINFVDDNILEKKENNNDLSEEKESGVSTYEYVFATKIPFDDTENGVELKGWAWLNNQDGYENSEKNPARDPRIIRFNETYANLLQNLQYIFGEGQIHKFGDAIGLMRQLQIDFNTCIHPINYHYIEHPDQPPIEHTSYRPDAIAPNWKPPTNLIPHNSKK